MKFSGSEVGGLLTMFVASGMMLCALFSDSWSLHYPKNVLERVYLSRGILEQCIVTRKVKDCQFRFRSLIGSLKFAFVDIYEVYTDHEIQFRHLPTKTFEVITAVLIIISICLCIGMLAFSPCLFRGILTGLITFIAATCALLACLSYFHANYTGSAFTMQSTQVMGHSYSALVCEKNYLSWAFFMAFASGVLLLTSSFCLCVAEREPEVEKEGEDICESQV